MKIGTAVAVSASLKGLLIPGLSSCFAFPELAFTCVLIRQAVQLSGGRTVQNARETPVYKICKSVEKRDSGRRITECLFLGIVV